MDKQQNNILDILISTLSNKVEDVGTEESGNYGHAGRPGKVGGSAPTSASPLEEMEKKHKTPTFNRECFGNVLANRCRNSMRNISDVLNRRISHGSNSLIANLFFNASKIGEITGSPITKVVNKNLEDENSGYLTVNGSNIEIAFSFIFKPQSNYPNYNAAVEHCSKIAECENTFVHEYSHYIDALNGYGSGSSKDSPLKKVFKELPQRDYSQPEAYKEYHEIMNIIYDKNDKEDAHDGNTRKLLENSMEYSDAEGIISDIFDAISGGKGFYLDFLPQGHGVTYYKKHSNRAIETFANLTALNLLHPFAYKTLKEKIPKLVSAYEEYVYSLEELLNAVNN